MKKPRWWRSLRSPSTNFSAWSAVLPLRWMAKHRHAPPSIVTEADDYIAFRQFRPQPAPALAAALNA
jgi:hypothetical protein